MRHPSLPFGEGRGGASLFQHDLRVVLDERFEAGGGEEGHSDVLDDRVEAEVLPPRHGSRRHPRADAQTEQSEAFKFYVAPVDQGVAREGDEGFHGR